MILVLILDALFIFNVFLSEASAAFICPPRKGQITDAEAIPAYVFKTATVGRPDRRSLQEFAKDSRRPEKEIAKKYTASGDIICGDHMAQAQLVLKNDMILVSNHLLYENRDCEKAKDVKQCKLYLMENGKRVIYDVARAEAEGFACPDKKSMKSRNDWAILRLARPVSASVKPYAIRSAPCVADGAPENVVFVGKSSDFRRDPQKPPEEAPRHFGACAIQKGGCSEVNNSVLLSDCDMDGGSSGGGLFTDGTDSQLIGIMSGLRNTCPESASEKSGPYSEKCWSSVAVPISGELQDRLESLATQ